MNEITGKVRLARAGKYDGRFVGYFLQYKAGAVVQRRSRYLPKHLGGGARRFELSTRPTGNPAWPWSQHETLTRLQAVLGSRGEVSYACPMLFGDVDVFVEPSLDDLRIVPLAGAPSLSLIERHFLYFDAIRGDPWWCSEPVRGTGLRTAEWVSRVALGYETNSDLVDMLRAVGTSFAEDRFRGRFAFPRQLTILELSPLKDG